ncbi:sigma-70 family RNA polymerase sigma factor [Nocardioides halotolerans]|uniref:sigma-70 family RNA polymerase sigma factor n=1 Tax=Nocardioides halotolerans TaxID=433660 RepID=UPI000410D7BD|nr:sigma-70 family RNA polymerase sigma factor [Nocardioides halotolerans]
MSSGGPPPDWAALYAKHKDKMWSVARKVLREAGRESDAADVVQEAMRSLMASPPKSVTNWEALMVATAKRRALDLLDSARVRHDGGELIEETTEGLASDEFLAEDVASAVDNQRVGGLLWDALGDLDPRDRQIVWRRFVHERSLRELAAEFGVSEGRISQITKAALTTLRAALEQQGIEGW